MTESTGSPTPPLLTRHPRSRPPLRLAPTPSVIVIYYVLESYSPSGAGWRLLQRPSDHPRVALAADTPASFGQAAGAYPTPHPNREQARGWQCRVHRPASAGDIGHLLQAAVGSPPPHPQYGPDGLQARHMTVFRPWASAPHKAEWTARLADAALDRRHPWAPRTTAWHAPTSSCASRRPLWQQVCGMRCRCNHPRP